MTGTELITKFQWLVDDDNTDQDQVLDLLNTSYDALLTERFWNFLKKSDTSNTFSGSTVNYNLPSDFMYPIKVHRYNSSNNTFVEMRIVRYEDRLRFNKLSNAIYFDIVNSRMTLLATPSEQGISGEVLYLTYQYQPSQLTTSTSPVFNRAFHSLVAYEAAKFFYYNDQQEKDRSFNREFQAEYNDLKTRMSNWDARLEASVAPDLVPEDSWVPDVA